MMQDVQGTQVNLLDQARQVAAKVAAALNPIKVILFGSTARSETTQESDIDLLVVMDHAWDRLKLMQEAHQAFTGSGESVDIMITDLAEVARRGHRKDWAMFGALQDEGIVLYEKEPDMPRDEGDRWLGLSRRHLRAAQHHLTQEDGDVLFAAFHAQQAAETGLNAVLAAHDLRVRKTHDLLELLDSLPVEAPGLDAAALKALTPWSEYGRYGIADPTREQAQAFAATAERVVNLASEMVAEVPGR